MCYNKETSFIIFLFSFIISVKFMLNEELDKKLLGGAILSLSLMQLLEFFIWYFLENKFYNILFTSLIPIVILIQGILSYYAIMQKNENNGLFIFETIMFTIFLVITCVILYFFYQNPKKSYVNKQNCK